GCLCRPAHPGTTGVTHCPVPDTGSHGLHITTDDGRLRIRCLAGCQTPAVIAVLRDRGLWPAAAFDEAGEWDSAEPDAPVQPSEGEDRKPGLTLDRYAGAKRLQREFLESVGLRDMTYL